VTAGRLLRLGVAVPLRDGRPALAAAALGGAHAQILTAAELSIGWRWEGATRTDVRAALWEEHSLIKTFGPRGTVHLLPARDLAMWTGALGALPRGASPFPEHVRMTPEQTEAVVAAMADALEDTELTVDELHEEVVARAGRWAGDLVMPAFQTLWPRWRQAVDVAAYRGVLCFGPNKGQNVTYTNPRRWLPGFRPASGGDALGWLIRSYLHAYGPAMPRDVAQWLAVSPAWMGEQFAARAADLERVDVEGETAWVVAGDTAIPDDPPRGVRLLPYFDAYGVGSHPRARVFPGAATRALAGSQAGNFPVLLIDGIVGGIWHQRRSGKKIAVTVEPLGGLSAGQRAALDVEVERVGHILEGRPELTIGPVTLGPHA
jgi:hypothetical protein